MRKYIFQTIMLSILFLGLINHSGYSKGLISKADSLYLNQQFGRANKFYSNMAYMRAINKYESLISQGFVNDSLNRNLAQAYFKIDSTKKSEVIYLQLAQSASAKSSDYFFLAQSLKSNQKYEEADKWMNRYVKASPADSRGDRQKNSAGKISELIASKNYDVHHVAFNSKYSDFGAVMYGDRVVFASARENNLVIKRKYAWNETPYLDIFSIKQMGDSVTNSVPFSTKLNSIYHDGPLCFSADEKEVYFTRNNFNAYLPKSGTDGVNHLKILHATKLGDGSWSDVKELAFNGDNFSTGHPSISRGGDTLYFASDRPGGFGNSDIYLVTRTATGWSEPQNLGSQINTEGDEMFPFLDRSNILYFSSNGHLGLGGLDIFATQKGLDGNYALKNLGAPINSSNDDFSFFLKKDASGGFVASNRAGGKGDDDIYSFTVLNQLSFNTKILLKGLISDAITKRDLNNSIVVIKNSKREVLKTIDTKQTNSFQLEVQPSDLLSLSVSNDKYFDTDTMANIAAMQKVGGGVLIPILLKPRPIEPFWGLYGNVFVLPSNEVVPKVEVTITPKDGSAERVLFTDSLKGGFKTRLSKNTDYDILFQKQGFFTKRVTYSTVGRDTGWVNLNQFVELAVKKAEIGASIEVKVLYDLGKSNIRSDAAQELNDMAEFLKDNPTISIELSSHTDSRGSDTSNQILSQKRAESATAYIVAKGISATRITSVGYGESRLKNKCGNGVKCSEEEHQQNRRTEVKIIGM